MTRAEVPSAPFSPIEALHLFTSLLGEMEGATPEAPGAFYNRLAEAVCRLGSTRSAVVFVYDDVARRVRVVGSHNQDIRLFDGHILDIETAPITGRALSQDQVLEGSADDVAEPYRTMLGLEHLVCVPLVGGGRGFGVILAEAASPRDLSDPERDALHSLGKVCALALSARMATRTQVDARHLADRIDLAREIHERVVQRIFGVVMALQSGVVLGPDDQARCGEELRGALDELRDAMSRPLAATPKQVVATLEQEMLRLADGDPAISVGWQDGVDIPELFEPVAQSVLAEAIRNARRHAEASRIDVAITGDSDTVSLEITNDGVGAHHPPAGAGMGLRIAAFEALQHGGSLTFGPSGSEHWHVRLTLPRPELA